MIESSFDRTLSLMRQLSKIDSTTAERWKNIPSKALIVVGPKASVTSSGQVASCLTLNLLSRLYPILTQLDVMVRDETLHYRLPLFDDSTLRGSMESFVRLVEPECEVKFVSNPDGKYDATLAVGNVDRGADIVIASSGWTAFLGSSKLSQDFDSANPIGGMVVASLGAAEVFKRVYKSKADRMNLQPTEYDPRERIRPVNKEVAFCCLDYKLRDCSHELPERIHIQDAVITGAGAGGGALLYALSSIPSLSGKLRLIDPDSIRPSNLNRYIYATRADAVNERLKVHVCKDLLDGSTQLVTEAYPIPYQEFATQNPDRRFGLVVSTVDTSQTRLAIQWDLPKLILDAAADGSSFYVRRVKLGLTDCLACTHTQTNGNGPSLEQSLAEITGLPEGEIVRLRTTKAPFEPSHIQAMRDKSQQFGFPLPNVGEAVDDWFLYHCGDLFQYTQEMAVPVPFATTLPGLLLAAQLLRLASLPEIDAPSHFMMDMLSSLDLAQATTRRPRPGCSLCDDSSTMEYYRKKYSGGVVL
ncbi:MAG: ThiF family adenylyltransferase [Thaumarchaeota archaeon]|nr:ThiF family adenylyltransferase [Nitrososphaerota archaeon]